MYMYMQYQHQLSYNICMLTNNTCVFNEFIVTSCANNTKLQHVA